MNYCNLISRPHQRRSLNPSLLRRIRRVRKKNSGKAAADGGQPPKQTPALPEQPAVN